MTEKFDFDQREEEEEDIDEDAIGALVKEIWKSARQL